MHISGPYIIKHIKKKIFLNGDFDNYYDMYPIVPPHGRFYYQYQSQYEIDDIVICSIRRIHRVIRDIYPALRIIHKQEGFCMAPLFRYRVANNLGFTWSCKHLKVFGKLIKVIDNDGKTWNY